MGGSRLPACNSKLKPVFVYCPKVAHTNGIHGLLLSSNVSYRCQNERKYTLQAKKHEHSWVKHALIVESMPRQALGTLDIQLCMVKHLLSSISSSPGCQSDTVLLMAHHIHDPSKHSSLKKTQGDRLF